MDRFDAMQAFVRVLETGSFTNAARTLHMSKTKVTQLVQQLEARLRVKLLNRTTRQVHATADGAAYYERAMRLLVDLEDAESSLSSATASLRGRLRVDVPSPVARLLLVPAFPEFHARYPELQIEMGVTDRMTDLIRDNVDCVIRGGKATPASLVARHVGDLPFGVYAAPSYLQRVGTPRHPLDLKAEPHRIVAFLSPRTGKLWPTTLRQGDARIEVKARHALAVDDGNAYLAAGLAGVGVLWLPTYMAKHPMARGELMRLFPDWAPDPMPLYLAFHPNRQASMKLRVFINWVVEVMAEHMTDVPESATANRQ